MKCQGKHRLRGGQPLVKFLPGGQVKQADDSRLVAAEAEFAIR